MINFTYTTDTYWQKIKLQAIKLYAKKGLLMLVLIFRLSYNLLIFVKT